MSTGGAAAEVYPRIARMGTNEERRFVRPADRRQDRSIPLPRVKRKIYWPQTHTDVKADEEGIIFVRPTVAGPKQPSALRADADVFIAREGERANFASLSR